MRYILSQYSKSFKLEFDVHSDHNNYSNLLLRYALPVGYAHFSRKTLCSKYFFSLKLKLKYQKTTNTKVLHLKISYTVFNLN